MPSIVGPSIISLAAATMVAAGGKAQGLCRLLAAGLAVPPGFVILGLTLESLADGLPQAVREAYGQLGGTVAVRSSAVGEDAVDASFAGQFQTVLNVLGEEALESAIRTCLESAQGHGVSAYQASMGNAEVGSMAVVVQKQVPARVAGVLFTVEPISKSRDRLLINAAAGLGENVVGGKARVADYVLSREGQLLQQSPHSVLSQPELAQLHREALQAEKSLGMPLDLEWAISEQGQLQWLQARPITSLELPSADELDTPLPDPGAVLTTYNISEILPGAMTPLSMDSIAIAIDKGFHLTYREAGVPSAVLASQPLLVMCSGHGFLSVSGLSYLSGYILGLKKEDIHYAAAGRPLPDSPVPVVPLWRRVHHTVGYFRTLLGAASRLEAFIQRAREQGRGTEPQVAPDLGAALRQVERQLSMMDESWQLHTLTTAYSGVVAGLLTRALSGGQQPRAQHHANAAVLLGSVASDPHAVKASSLGLGRAIEELAAVISASADKQWFVGLPVEQAATWLQNEAPKRVREQLAELLAEHGHRGIREVEMHDRDWAEDPRPLVRSVQATVRRGARPPVDRAADAEPVLAALPRWQRWLVDQLLGRASASVVTRERSKSMAVRMTRGLKRSYQELARHLSLAGRLKEPDHIYFLRHAEVLALVRGPDPAIQRRALHRRRLYAQHMTLGFPAVCFGKPVPIPPPTAQATEAVVLQGTTVCSGIVTARARVATTPEQAAELEPGEILIVPHIDVGWMPYFQHAGGLATEIGGTLSHGAVVARELGLPTVVNLEGATRLCQTGDLVCLDGTKGVLTRL